MFAAADCASGTVEMIQKSVFFKWKITTKCSPSEPIPSSPFNHSGAEFKSFYFIFLARTPTGTLAVKDVSSSGECDGIVLHSSASGHRCFASSCKLCPKRLPAASFTGPQLFSLFVLTASAANTVNLMNDSWGFSSVHKPVLTSSGHECSSVLHLK